MTKFLAVDPGEDTGWSIWSGDILLDAGTTKMWDFSDAVWEAVLRYITPTSFGEIFTRSNDELSDALEGINLIVCEDFRLYPWAVMSGELNWDEVRTARLIGSLYAACRLTGWTWEVQPAAIKERAEAAGADAYFYYPLHENRHTNDSIRHGVFYIARSKSAAWTDLSQHEFTIEADV